MNDVTVQARELGIDEKYLLLYGRDKAKVALAAMRDKPERGRLILVSAITPTPAGEGKTTISIGLSQGLRKLGQSVALALRQPSMGPVFGRKGGATGGGKSTVQPATSINLHFTGDFHAITSAHNLLSAVIDNQLFNLQTRLTPDRVLWKRVMDVNDRALRNITVNRGSKKGERFSGFDITAASEIMAILCLAESMDDLRARVDRIVVGFAADNTPVYAKEFRCTGAMLALLSEAIMPNLVQSVEGVPAFIHGGPFANIAHGCNSVIATRLALAHADLVVTECGFAFDLGGEKFLDIKCRQSGLKPAAIVIVATVRALKMHGGVAVEELNTPNPGAVTLGLDNLAAHLAAAKSFGRPVTVAINRFPSDTDEELSLIHKYCESVGAVCATAEVFAQGGDGAIDLAKAVLATMPAEAPPLVLTYPDDAPVKEKMLAIATRFYGADRVDLTPEAESKLALLEHAGFGRLPLCMAKTQNSLSDDAKKFGRPRGFRITVRDFEIANGAGFIVALTGEMMRMPALPKVPSSERIDVNAAGEITGIASA